MGESESERILSKIDQLFDRMARLEVTVTSSNERSDEKIDALSERIDRYNNVTGRMAQIESDMRSQREACAAVQESKKNKSINWGAVWGTIIGGSIMLVIGSLFVKWGLK